jgi:amino acid efflux transporter
MLEGTKNKEASMASLVELGLGKEIANTTYIILLGTVIFGMPSAAIIAGKYVGGVIALPYVVEIVPFIILAISFFINIKGIDASSKAATLITVLILIISIALISVTIKPIESYSVLKPSFNIGNIYEGAVLAFWAFAGFENLTFLYDQFEKPKRDLLITIIVSILFCGIIYISLVANYAALIPLEEVNNTIGLLQLAKSVPNPNVIYVISLFAFFAVLINFISWTSGIVSLMKKSVTNNVLNSKIIYCYKSKNSPIFLLYTLFAVNTMIGLISPSIFENILKTVSSNFLILYFMLISSFVLFTRNLFKKILAIILSAVLVLTISSSGILLIYPLILFMVSIIYTIKNEGKVEDEIRFLK